MRLVATPIHFYPTAETHGYAVVRTPTGYMVLFVKIASDGDKSYYVVVGSSKSNGKLLEFPTLFQADYVLRHEVLPLYSKLYKSFSPLIGNKVVH